MFQPWRLKLREAERALADGRWEEAGRLLMARDLCEFLPAKQLLSQLVARYVERGQQEVSQGQLAAAWQSRAAASRLGAGEPQLAPLDAQLAARVVAEAQTALRARQPHEARTLLQSLSRQQLMNESARRLRSAADAMEQSQRLARRGRFADAAGTVEIAARLLPELETLAALGQEYKEQAVRHRELSHALHQALAAADWSRGQQLAESLLELAPDDGPARDARRRAWAAVGTQLAESIAPAAARVVHRDRRTLAFSVDPSVMVESSSTAVAEHRPRRTLFWVDAVGGFLICHGDEVWLGQPLPGGEVDIPLLGDLSRVHAKIRREGEGYLLDPVRPTWLDGRQLSQPAALADGNLIRLGGAVTLRFRRPHPLSGSARLEFVSGHRTQPSVDGIVLMSESCVLGPSATSHIVCPDWPHEVVVFRQGEELYCRAAVPLAVNGAAAESPAPLGPSAHVAGDDFSFSTEPW